LRGPTAGAAIAPATINHAASALPTALSPLWAASAVPRPPTPRTWQIRALAASC